MCHATSLERFADLPLSPLTSLWLDTLQQTNTSHYSKMDQAQPDEITLASMTMTMENNPVSNHDAALESSSNPVLDEIHVRIRSEQFRARDRIDRLQRIREQRTARLNASRSRLSALGVSDGLVCFPPPGYDDESRQARRCNPRLYHSHLRIH